MSEEFEFYLDTNYTGKVATLIGIPDVPRVVDTVATSGQESSATAAPFTIKDKARPTSLKLSSFSQSVDPSKIDPPDIRRARRSTVVWQQSGISRR